MSIGPQRTRRRRVTLAVTWLVVPLLVVLAAGPAAGQSAAAEDPAVVEAQERLGAARAELGRLTTELDAAAAAYEHAHAHSLRLDAELVGADATVAASAQRVDDVRDAFSDRVSSAYMHPGLRASLAGAVLVAPDGATALHRAALLRRVAVVGAERVEDAEALQAATADAVRQHRIVQAGSVTAAAERERFASDLTVAVGNAQHRLGQAQDRLAAEQQAAARRVREAEEQAERERAASEAAARSAARSPQVHLLAASPPTAVDGKVCPLGAPNGFIDSWGFPRSGGRSHQGVDMFAAYGMPLYAVADGVVDRVYSNRLGGLSIWLTDVNGDRYYYAHLSGATASPGQRVNAGDVIGAAGDSGNARGTPPHLHWQVHPGGGAPVNPFPLAAALCR